jgi:AcrR family transcriptional regulator
MVPISDRQDARAEREELILARARLLLMEEGFHGLNLDAVAKAADCAKGTLYLHFSSKEDLALAVATRALRERADLFERATKFQGLTRERARAIGFACCQFVVSHPDYFHVELMLKSSSFWEKASPERQRAHGMQSGRCFRAMSGIVLSAIEAGDLPRGPIPPEQIAFGMAAVTMGSHIMSQVPELCLFAGIEDPVTVVRQNQDAMLDGFGWKPLRADYDYAATDQRIRREIFPEATWLC